MFFSFFVLSDGVRDCVRFFHFLFPSPFSSIIITFRDLYLLRISSCCREQTGKDPDELKRVTRVKPIDSFSARWDSIVHRLLERESSDARECVLET